MSEEPTDRSRWIAAIAVTLGVLAIALIGFLMVDWLSDFGY